LLERITLSNGTTLLCEPVPHVEAVAIGFWFLHGSRDETADERGFSHFLEHMIFKGTPRRNPSDIALEIDRVGGAINAATEKEITSVYTSVPYQYFLPVLDVMCDIAFSSTLPDEEIEKEKIVVSNEVASIEDSPEEKGFELFVETIWNGHPLAEKIAGTLDSIKSITAEKLHQFYRKYFIPARLVVSVAGNFDPQLVARELEQRLNSSVPGGPREAQIFFSRTPPAFIPGTHFIEDVFTQAQVYYAEPFPQPNQMSDYYEHLIVSTAFGESMSSRLFQTIREKEGLCYSVYSSRAYYSDTALWLLYANTMPELAARLLVSLERELGRLFQEPLSAQEIDDARLQIKGSLILSKQDVEVRMKRLARQFIAMGEILTYEECFQIIDSISKPDCEKLITALLGKANAGLMVYGCKGLKKLKNSRKKKGPFSVTREGTRD
jgi:predicted Zn-dependent peptidase